MIDVDLDDERVPRNARKLAELAVEHGYKVRLTWAEWRTVDDREAQGESLAVRMWPIGKIRRSCGVVAIWRNGLFSSGGMEFQPMTLTKVKATIRGE